MATNFVSGTVAAGTDATAVQYNNLRADSVTNGGDYATAGGTGDVITLAIDASIAAYDAGQVFKFLSSAANTTSVTLNVNGIGALAIRKNHDVALAANDIESGQVVEVVYDGSIFQMISVNAEPVLKGGTTTNADALHTHDSINRGFNATMITPLAGGTLNKASLQIGFSDAATPLIASVGRTNMIMDFGIATDYGITIYPFDFHDNSGVNADFLGVVRIGSDDWTSRSANTIRKNAGDGTFVSGDEQGPLGHDATNSYLLMLTSTTNIRRFSGIAGTALTQVDNITLDTAVTETIGFVFDDTNNRYVCVDASNNLIRRFDSAGATIDTASYTVDDTYLAGLAIINNRFYLVMLHSIQGDTTNNVNNPINVITCIPTTMTR